MCIKVKIVDHKSFLLVSARIEESEVALVYSRWATHLDEQSNTEASLIRKIRQRFHGSGDLGKVCTASGRKRWSRWSKELHTQEQLEC